MSLEFLRRVDYSTGPEGIVDAYTVNLIAFNVVNAVDYPGFDNVGEEFQLREVINSLVNYNQYVVGGTDNDITLTNISGNSTYVDGMIIRFVAKYNNSGAVTLKVNSGNVYPVEKTDGSMPESTIIKDSEVVLRFDSTTNKFLLVNSNVGTVSNISVGDDSTSIKLDYDTSLNELSFIYYENGTEISVPLVISSDGTLTSSGTPTEPGDLVNLETLDSAIAGVEENILANTLNIEKTVAGIGAVFFIINGSLYTSGKKWGIGGYGTYTNSSGGESYTSFSGLLDNIYKVVINADSDRVVDVFLLGRSVFVLTDKNDLWSWGLNDSGVLGLGHNNIVTIPTLTLSGVKRICEFGVDGVSAAYLYNTMIVEMTDGTFKGTGNNAYGQLGIGNTTSVNVWTLLQIPSGSRVIQNCGYLAPNWAITTDNKILVWGYDGHGSAGAGIGAAITSPTDVTTNWNPDGWTVQSIRSNNPYKSTDGSTTYYQEYTLITLQNDSTGEAKVMASGLNGYGQCGDGTTTSITIPKMIFYSQTPIKKTTIEGAINSKILLENGDLYSFGYGVRGVNGDGTTDNILSPKLVYSGVLDIVNSTYGPPYAATRAMSFIKFSNGVIRTTGISYDGVAGIGINDITLTSYTQIRLPVDFGLDLKEILFLYNGLDNNVMIAYSNNRVFVWGNSYYGALTSTTSSYEGNITIPTEAQYSLEKGNY